MYDWVVIGCMNPNSLVLLFFPLILLNVLKSNCPLSCATWRYMSKYRPKVVLETKSNKQAMRTMGPAKVELPSPDNYLKKRSKEPKLPDSKCVCQTQWLLHVLIAVCVNHQYQTYLLSILENELSTKVSRTCSDRKPPVPEKTAPPIMGIVTKRNFIRTVTTEPMKPQPTSVDSIKGDKQLLENSGLVPKYSKKKVFFFYSLGFLYTCRKHSKRLFWCGQKQTFLLLFAAFWKTPQILAEAHWRRAESSWRIQQLPERTERAGSHDTRVYWEAKICTEGKQTDWPGSQSAVEPARNKCRSDINITSASFTSLLWPSRVWGELGTSCIASTRLSHSSSTPCRRRPTRHTWSQKWCSWRMT